MTSVAEHVLVELDPAGAAMHEEDILRVYAAAMMPPPYNKSIADVQMFAGTLQRHRERDGFRMFVARSGSHIVGYTWGYQSVPGGWWRDQVADVLEPDLARHWLSDAFEFAELAVTPTHQRRGIGGDLHDALIAGVENRCALLSTLAEDTAGSKMYEGKGWRTLVPEMSFSGFGLPYRVMGLELRGVDA